MHTSIYLNFNQCEEIWDAYGTILNIGWAVTGASLNFQTLEFGKIFGKVNILFVPNFKAIK